MSEADVAKRLLTDRPTCLDCKNWRVGDRCNISSGVLRDCPKEYYCDEFCQPGLYKLKAEWSKQSERDMRAFKAIDVEQTLIDAASRQMANCIDQEMIDKLKNWKGYGQNN